jgi:uncharacterized membrane protein YhhN
MTKSNLSLAFFFVNALVLMWGEFIFSRDIILITKPLLMPLLAIWLWFESLSFQGIHAVRLRNTWLIGLAFSTLGDILLMFTGKQSGSSFFLMGLCSFLCAHLSFIYALNAWRGSESGLVQREPEWVLPFLGYITGLLWFLWAGIPAAMKGPVIIYAIVISTMMISVLQLRDMIRQNVFYLLFGGAILFALSDSIIALNKFGQSFSSARISIMLTYIIGQSLMAYGISRLLKLSVAHQPKP